MAAVWVVSGCTSADRQTADWTGEWSVRWRDGGARFIVEQSGDMVTGAYPLFEGRIEGRAQGRELRGRLTQMEFSGDLFVVQSRDGSSFAGRFSSGQWVTGVRSDSAERNRTFISQATSAATMKSLLRLKDDVTLGSTDSLATALALIVPDPQLSDRLDEVEYVKLLFNVFDGLTVRFWDFPISDTADVVPITLRQSGTDVSLDIEFRRVQDKWMLVPPARDTLRAVRERIRIARDIPSATPDKARPLNSPRAAFDVFLKGMRTGVTHSGANPAYAALNTSELPDVGRRGTVDLYADYVEQVLNRIGYVYLQEIPDDPNSREPYLYFQHPEGDIVVAPFATDKGVQWQFTPGTLRSIRRVFAAIDDLPLSEPLSAIDSHDPFFLARSHIRSTLPVLLEPWGPMEGWQWLALAGTVAAALGMGALAGRGARWIVPSRAIGAEAGQATDKVVLWIIRISIGAVVGGMVLLIGTLVFGWPGAVAALATTIGLMLIMCGTVPIAWETLTRAANTYQARHGVAGRSDTLLSLTTGFARILLVVIAVVLLANALGVPYQGVIAGLGIGGLAVALAIQPLLQNFLSGFMLYADRPIAVGDFCRFGDKLGTVEHVGVRSTQVRSLDRTVITIPNAQFADLQLENYSRRDRIWLKATLQLRYETSPDQLRYILVELRKLLITHPKILSDPLRVRLIGFGAYSLDVEMYAYVATQDFDEFVAIREDILLRTMKLMEEAGVQFAFPSSVEYRADDTSPDPDLRRRVEQSVEQWRAEGKLPFPDFDWHDKADLRDTLDYPPEGSILKEDDKRKPT